MNFQGSSPWRCRSRTFLNIWVFRGSWRISYIAIGFSACVLDWCWKEINESWIPKYLLCPWIHLVELLKCFFMGIWWLIITIILMRFIFFISHTESLGNVALSSVLIEKLSCSSDFSVKINGKWSCDWCSSAMCLVLLWVSQLLRWFIRGRECWHDPNKLSVLHYSILQRKHILINTGTLRDIITVLNH